MTAGFGENLKQVRLDRALSGARLACNLSERRAAGDLLEDACLCRCEPKERGDLQFGPERRFSRWREEDRGIGGRADGRTKMSGAEGKHVEHMGLVAKPQGNPEAVWPERRLVGGGFGDSACESRRRSR